MIRIHYRPLEALRPIHIALLASLDPPTSSKEVASRLRIPQMMMDHAADDVLAWSLARPVEKTLALTEQGSRCIAVWTVTNKKGFWEFENGEGWLLGKGVFSFRKPLKSIKYANLDPETGDLTSEKDAKERLKEYLLGSIQIEKEIKEQTLRTRLLEAFNDGKDLSGVIEETIARARTTLQINQLCRIAESTLVQLQQPGTENKREHSKDALGKGHRAITKVRGETQRQLRDRESTVHDVTDALLAAWLEGRTGLLNEIARSQPGALVVRSEFADFSWMEERPAPQKKSAPKMRNENEPPARASEPPQESLIGSILKFLFS